MKNLGTSNFLILQIRSSFDLNFSISCSATSRNEIRIISIEERKEREREKDSSLSIGGTIPSTRTDNYAARFDGMRIIQGRGERFARLDVHDPRELGSQQHRGP